VLVNFIYTSHRYKHIIQNISPTWGSTIRGGLRHRRSRPWPRVPRLKGPRARRAGNFSSMRCWKTPKAFGCNKRKFVLRSMSSVVLKNNKASNTHIYPNIFFSALGPRTEHCPRAPLTLKPPLLAISDTVSFACIWLQVTGHVK
jgi:hypothetical protein